MLFRSHCPCQKANSFLRRSTRTSVRSLPLFVTSLEADHLQGSVASLGRVLGNRTALTKYLNPHLIAVATLRPSSDSASILLIDSSSGAIVHTVPISHVTSDSNLRVFLRGNWLIYTLREAGDFAQATRVVSVELYNDVQHPFRSGCLAFATVAIS